MRTGFEDFYTYTLDTNKNISAFGKQFGLNLAAYQIRIQEKNMLEGEFNYPIPLTFQLFNPKTNQVYLTSTFFLDSGTHKIQLPEMFNCYEVNINSPVNNEYSKFKKLFSDLYVARAYDRLFDSLTDLKKKEQRIASYIENNPNSYVAFWEIVSDYKRYNYNPIYLENLELFSPEIKKNRPLQKIWK